MYVVVVDFTIHPSRFGQFFTLMMENARQSRSKESGCRQLDVCLDPARPDAVFLYEVYDDETTFRAHLVSSHYQAFDGATRDMISVKQVRVLERRDD